MALRKIAYDIGVDAENYRALWKECKKQDLLDELQDIQDDYWGGEIDTAVQRLYLTWSAIPELRECAEISVSWVDLWLMNKDEGGDCGAHYSFSERFCDLIQTLSRSTTLAEIHQVFVREKQSIKKTIAFYPMNRVLLEMIKELK